jgi:uncharacterized protein DUF6924
MDGTPGADPVPKPQLPSVAKVPLVRTDFSDDAAWRTVSGAVRATQANVDLVDDITFEGLAPAELCRLVPLGREWPLLFVADQTAMTSAEHHVLVVDLGADDAGRTFRAVPEVIPDLEMATMQWEDFAYSADVNGVVPTLWG